MSLGSGGGRSVCLWRCRLLSVPLGEQASGRRRDCLGLDHVVRRCFGTKWYGEVPDEVPGIPEMLTPAMRTTAVLLVFYMPCSWQAASALPWQAALASAMFSCHDKRLGKCHVQLCHDKRLGKCHVQLCHDKRLGKCHVQLCHDKRLGKCHVQLCHDKRLGKCHVQLCHDKRLGKWFW